MRSIAAFVSGRRTKWMVLGAWVLLVLAMAPFGGKLQDEVNDQFESFLPGSAESTEVVRLLNRQFDQGTTANALIVYQRKGGLTPADQQKIASDAARAKRTLPLVGPPVVPFQRGSPPQLVSSDRALAYSILQLPDDFEKLGDQGKDLRKITGDGQGGLRVYVTGDVGFSADFEDVFGDLDAKLLLATVLLVLVLLGAIYRSPLIALTPLVVVGVAYTIAQGFIYFWAKSGATVNSNATQILIVLMFGIGTDYCLLLLSRYREELRRQQDKHAAMARAVRRAGPAILASGLTVALAMLVMAFAETGSVSALGPAAAIGVLSVLVAGLTLLPAVLTIFGRRGFWPRRSTVEFDPEAEVAVHRGLWRRFGDRVLQRPAAALAVTVLIFGAGSLGLLAYEEDYSNSNQFKTQTESVDGQKVLEKAFPAGATNPTTVLVQRRDGPVRPTDVQAVVQRLRGVTDVAEVVPVPQPSRDRRVARVDVVFKGDPYSAEQLNRVPDLRERVKDAGPGLRVLVGGGSAVYYDFDQAAARDTKLIVPLGLAIIAVILGILLQAMVAPLVLIATVMASFFGTLGISFVFFRYVVGDEGVDSSMPIFAFIFLVALGVDYTIFLMSRVREEARRFGTREGTLRALAATGPVITSAGIILAGTFSVLMTLPVTFAFQLGFMVTVGILLDTFVVRTIMVPAAVELIGDRIWWPSDPSGGARVLREAPEPEAKAPPPVAAPG
jgi:putative drug exporter of the RND superfamily